MRDSLDLQAEFPAGLAMAIAAGSVKKRRDR